jgi:hypothetical protein
MRLASFIAVAAVFCFIGCAPKHYTGATVEASRPGETKVINIGPEYDTVTLRAWYRNNRGADTSKVAGEVQR